MPSRREKLEALLADEPGDTFLRYALAMEWQKEGDVDKALGSFQDLIRQQPPHVPAYFMAAKMLVAEQRVSDARSFLREGIEQARAQGETHAAAEMSEYLEALGHYGQ